MSQLSTLEPREVFSKFEEICKIPHISCHEKQLSDYCFAFAKERGYFCKQDEFGNVLIIADASAGYEEKEPVILQAHLDMVGEKIAGCALDLEKDAIEVLVDGEVLRADGSTLGADNGIGVSYLLALLDEKELPHPRMEILLTVQEEVGLVGAANMDLSLCQGRRMINLDSEEEGILTVGCAGGKVLLGKIPLTRVKATGLPHIFTLEGLLGGHSGLDIHKGRANVNELLGRFFLLLQKKASFEIISAFGGMTGSAIPKEGRMSLLLPAGEELGLIEAVDEFRRQIEEEYGETDPDIQLKVSVGKEVSCMVLDEASKKRAISFFALFPNGVESMSAEFENLVETSSNLGLMHLEDEELELVFVIRSLTEAKKEQLADKITLLVEMLDGKIEVLGDGSAWSYQKESALKDSCVDVFEKQYERKPVVQTIHAGLECSVFVKKLQGLDCISLGPTMTGVHTPNERLSIASVGRVWEYLKNILAAL